MRNLSIKTLYILSWLILISGLFIAGYGLYNEFLALTVSGIGLIGSFVGMFTSATQADRMAQIDRPYITLNDNNERYSVIQIEIKNVGHRAAIIEEFKLNINQIELFGGGNLQEATKGLAVMERDKKLYPYIVLGNTKFNDRYVNISGEVFYSDLQGNRYSNNVILSLENLKPTLSHSKESIKRDHEIINAAKAVRKYFEAKK